MPSSGVWFPLRDQLVDGNLGKFSDIAQWCLTVDDVRAERAVGIMVIMVMIVIVKGKCAMTM